jgi:cold shock protein
MTRAHAAIPARRARTSRRWSCWMVVERNLIDAPHERTTDRRGSMNGMIKRLVRDRGFGFIRDDNGQEWFFHRSAVRDGSFDQLNEGQRVSFEEEESAKGPRASNVRGEAA